MLAGAIIFILCQRLIAGSEKSLPSIPGERQDQVSGKVRYTKLLAASVALLTVAAIISSFMLRSNLPDLSGKSAAKAEKNTEKKEDRKKDRVAAADYYKPDATNFPFFRGQDGRGIAGGTGYPVEWNGENGSNIKWKIEVPKNGKSSPVIWGDKLFVTGADGTNARSIA